jgi:hypothetical protein
VAELGVQLGVQARYNAVFIKDMVAYNDVRGRKIVDSHFRDNMNIESSQMISNEFYMSFIGVKYWKVACSRRMKHDRSDVPLRQALLASPRLLNVSNDDLLLLKHLLLGSLGSFFVFTVQVL